MSRQRVVRTLCAGGALAAGLALSGMSVGATSSAKAPSTVASRSATTTTTTTSRQRVPAGYHGAKPATVASTYTVGVDAPPPAGHNIEFVDYFPRNLTVNPGTIIDFTWASGLSPDSFHTATLLKPGETAAQDSANFPVVAPELSSVLPSKAQGVIGSPQAPGAPLPGGGLVGAKVRKGV